jgi:hypothetical protein
MRDNPFFSRVGELIRSPSAPRVARWLPHFPILSGDVRRPMGSQRQLRRRRGRAGGSRRRANCHGFKGKLALRRLWAAVSARLRARACSLYRTQFHFRGFLRTVRSSYRAHTPIEGLVAIIARNRIIRLAFVTPRCFRRPEDDKGSPRGISSERFAASAGREGASG